MHQITEYFTRYARKQKIVLIRFVATHQNTHIQRPEQLSQVHSEITHLVVRKRCLSLLLNLR